MLHYLRTENAIEMSLGQAGEVREDVGHLCFQALRAAQFHRFRAQFDTSCRNVRLLHHLEEFAAAAADIEHVVAALEVRQVELLSRRYIFFGAAEALRKA